MVVQLWYNEVAGTHIGATEESEERQFLIFT